MGLINLLFGPWSSTEQLPPSLLCWGSIRSLQTRPDKVMIFVSWVEQRKFRGAPSINARLVIGTFHQTISRVALCDLYREWHTWLNHSSVLEFICYLEEEIWVVESLWWRHPMIFLNIFRLFKLISLWVSFRNFDFILHFVLTFMFSRISPLGGSSFFLPVISPPAWVSGLLLLYIQAIFFVQPFFPSTISSLPFFSLDDLRVVPLNINGDDGGDSLISVVYGNLNI